MRALLFTLLLVLLTGCSSAEDALTLHAVNVGKADALLLRSGEDVYLIDTGTAESWGALSRALHSQGIDHLTGVIVTHTDSDHAGGAAALAQSSIQVGTWYASCWYTCKESKHPVIKAAQLRGQAVTWLSAGDVLPLDGGTLTVIGPTDENPDKENNNSLVLLAERDGVRLLLAGDMEFPEEKLLLARRLIPACDVLKVGNHGESDATSPDFIQAVQPKLAVISTNTAEEPDTPSARVMRLLSTVGAQVWQTQHAESGVLVTVSGGVASAAYAPSPVLATAAEGMVILDKGQDDSIRLRNTSGRAIDLTDWFIYSERGKEIFVFPAGAVAQPGQTLTVVSQSSEGSGDYVWPDTKVWHKSKPDRASLCDALGREMAAME
ncbi:MAG: MBL fold metallo-hydrolase [Aristaeellaceae bacterium]